MSVVDGVLVASGAHLICKALGLEGWPKHLVTACAAIAAAILSRSVLGLRRKNFPLEAWIEKSVSEDAIDPDRPMIDPHHHLWDVRTQDKGWGQPPSQMKLLYLLKPFILAKLHLTDTKKQAPAVVNTFSSCLPFIVPYMANNLLRDIHNAKQGGHPLTEKEKRANVGHNIRATVYLECGWKDEGAVSKAMESVGEAGMAQGVADASANRLCTGIVAHVPLREGARACRPAFEALNKYPNVCGIRDALSCNTNPAVDVVNGCHAGPRAAYDPQSVQRLPCSRSTTIV